MKNSLQTNSITKLHHNKLIIDSVSISVNSNEVVGLLGPNGAGKTTCFYVVCGLIKPNSGSVYINNNDISNLPMHKRALMGLTYLPQEASIFRQLTVEDNIMAVLETRKDLNSQAKKNMLRKLLEEFNLNRIRNSYGVALSGGERRRTEIARCLAIRPKFILLDEPFAGVDPLSVNDIQKIIAELKNKGIGVLVTDHSYREMLETCDRSYVLNAGKIIAEGSKEKILANKIVRQVYLGDNP